MDFSPQSLRGALGRFATGVTIMSVQDKTGCAYGVTVNSLVSVSLDPPLILWCLRRTASIHDVFERNDRFGVNILDAGSKAISARHAASGQIRLKSGGFALSPRGIPLMNMVLATFECETLRRDDGGDHTILLARVLNIHEGHDGAPLVFYEGNYRKLEKLSKKRGKTRS